MKQFKIFHSLLVLLTILIFALPVQAKKSRVAQKSRVHGSIHEAMNRSTRDQGRLKRRIHKKTEKQMKSWAERSQESIQIVDHGSAGRLQVGNDDYSMGDAGEDHSGLNSLKSHVEIESTDIDFDAELREVSSFEN